MSRNSSLLLISMVFENVVCETIRAYSIISFARQANGTFLSLMVPTVLLVGPVFVGVIAGAITDHMPRHWFIYPIASLAIVASTALVGVQLQNQTVAWCLLTAVAILSYLSINIRIAVSKFAIRKEEYSKFHSGVVWVLQLAPIASPLLAAGLASNAVSIWLSFSSFFVVSIAGAAIFHSVVKDRTENTRTTAVHRVTFAELRETLHSAWKLVVSDDALRRSVVIASLQNVFVFVSGSVATVQFQSTPTFAVLGGLPLFVAGCGAFVGATLAGGLKKRFGASVLLIMALALSAGAIVGQAVLQPGIGTLIAVLLVGMDGAITAVCAWDIRLERSSKSNIGSVAGLTGTLYKLPSMIVLPLVASIGERFGSSSTLFSSVIVVCAFFVLSFVAGPRTRYKSQ